MAATAAAAVVVNIYTESGYIYKKMRVASLSLFLAPSLETLMDRPTLFTQVGLVHLLLILALSLIFCGRFSISSDCQTTKDDDDGDDLPPIN